jgi:PKD repeat protein
VGTFDNSVLKLYVNGVLEGSTPSTFNGFDYMQGKEVFIGNTNESFNFPFVGTIDNLRFYNRSLNQQEVTALYTQDPACIPTVLPPVSQFSASSLSVCAGGTISLTDQSQNVPTSWNWQVNGGTASNSTSSVVTYTFSNPGIYTASLVTANSAGSSANTATQSLMVLANPNVSAVAVPSVICKGEFATLQANGAAGYLWSNAQSGNSITVNPQLQTTYTVKGTDQNGCSNTATVLLKVFSCTSLQENGNESWTVFPVPASDEVQVHAGINMEYQILIYDLTGKEFLKREFNERSAVGTKIDVRFLAPGIYFLTVRTWQESRNFKLIKQ